METFSSKYLETAVQEIGKLPGIGKKTALRLALHIVRHDENYAFSLSEAISNLKRKVCFCTTCHAISDSDVCDICANPLRDFSTICVVETIKDVLVIEATQQFRGVYHVLGGVISPIDGVSPFDLEIQTLVERVERGGVEEIIFALPVTVEGDTTSFYIHKKLQQFSCKISMIARGVAVGNELEYTDELTLARSIRDRVEYKA
ncbi:MAG: recombination mediator RecR [Bacteroidales bacterium]|nr:recombination mediator RecR [Bacteroidales bacterium]